MFKLKANERSLLVLFILYRILLDVCFVVYLNEYYSFSGFALDFNLGKYLGSLFVLLLFFILLSKQNNKPSEALIQFLFLTTFVPISSYYAMSNEETNWFLLSALFWFIILIFQNSHIYLKTINLQTRLNTKTIIYSLIIFILLVFAIVINYTGVSFNINLYKVYEIRAESKLHEIPFAGYFVNWTAKVILPFLILYYFLREKNKFNYKFISLVLLAVLLFSITGHKSYLFIVPMVLGSFYLLKTKSFYFSTLLVLCFIIVIGMFLFFTFNEPTIITFLVRRTLFLPAQISFYYYDFFKGEPIYLSNSIFSSFIDYPYTKEPAFLIGKYYLGKESVSANNGIISDGYANFGVFGVVLWSIFFFLLTKLVDSITKNKSIFLILPIMLVSFKTFIDAAFFTTLLTHGLLIALLISYVYPKNNLNLK